MLWNSALRTPRIALALVILHCCSIVGVLQDIVLGHEPGKALDVRGDDVLFAGYPPRNWVYSKSDWDTPK